MDRGFRIHLLGISRTNHQPAGILTTGGELSLSAIVVDFPDTKSTAQKWQGPELCSYLMLTMYLYIYIENMYYIIYTYSICSIDLHVLTSFMYIYIYAYTYILHIYIYMYIYICIYIYAYIYICILIFLYIDMHMIFHTLIILLNRKKERNSNFLCRFPQLQDTPTGRRSWGDVGALRVWFSASETAQLHLPNC